MEKIMRLLEVTITKYKSFLTEQIVPIEGSCTRLVGKNESGKTAFLEALSRFNYFDEKDSSYKFNKTLEYPRTELKKYESENPENNLKVISCKFSLKAETIDAIIQDCGENVLLETTIVASRDYNNALSISTPKVSEKAFIVNYILKIGIPEGHKEELAKIENVNDFCTYLSSHEETKSIAETLVKTFSFGNLKEQSLLSKYLMKKYIEPRIPKFWYFDEYFLLPQRIPLSKIAGGIVDNDFTKPQLEISRALFELARIDVKKLITDNNHEAYIAELEATSNSITDAFSDYWSTNSNLEITFDIETTANDKYLNIRIRNTKHRVTLPLSNRSKGFIWFFSFFIWFQKINQINNMILLLDEPGLNLHAEAQKDLLRYIDEKLTPKYQVIYTTHSPFMIDSTKLHEIRTAYDSNETKVGTSISNAIEEKDKGTLFPLQAALGYNLAQNLYISENNLLVEGVADLVILTIMSDLLRNLGKESLNEKFTIVPVGGLDKVATFISLLRGNNLNIVCVLDTFIDQKGQTRIRDLVFDKIIKESNVLFFHEFTGPIKPAELEDMFEKREYLEWFNSEYKKDYEQIDIKKLSTDKSIIPQINKIIHQDRFNHYRIARYLSQNISTIHDWEKSTISRFEKLFITVNKLIK
ncbi:MAG: hypothetical protein CVV48_05585 [Spirochaetae bacterium HGW-Spirochaetae-4]|nr:MAG: hypothetical protein CVV48_05585 [Spirochaetae bacterium HGW-Spirochaetae-4]